MNEYIRMDTSTLSFVAVPNDYYEESVRKLNYSFMNMSLDLTPYYDDDEDEYNDHELGFYESSLINCRLYSDVDMSEYSSECSSLLLRECIGTTLEIENLSNLYILGLFNSKFNDVAILNCNTHHLRLYYSVNVRVPEDSVDVPQYSLDYLRVIDGTVEYIEVADYHLKNLVLSTSNSGDQITITISNNSNSSTGVYAGIDNLHITENLEVIIRDYRTSARSKPVNILLTGNGVKSKVTVEERGQR